MIMILSIVGLVILIVLFVMGELSQRGSWLDAVSIVPMLIIVIWVLLSKNKTRS
jgi:hypothetical protein